MSTSRYERPLKPSLASNRTAKTPLTPRLAAAPASNSTPTLQSRQTPRADLRSPKAPLNEGKSTPVKAFLNNNVTPRSSSRKSRAGSITPSGTPTGTPSGTRPTSAIDTDLGLRLQGLDIGGHAHLSNGRPRSFIAAGGQNITNPPTGAGHGLASTSNLRDDGPRFFHASDVKAPEPSPVIRKSPTFFYADGKEEPTSNRSVGVPSPPLSAVSRNRPQGYFNHPGTAKIKPRSPAATPPLLSPSPDLPAQSNSLHKPPPLRPPSPHKGTSHVSFKKPTSSIQRPETKRTPTISVNPSPSSNEADIRARRRSSAASTLRRTSHQKSPSLSSIESIMTPQKPSPQTSDVSQPSVSSPLLQHLESDDKISPIGPPRLTATPDSIAELLEDHAMHETASSPQSPTKSTSGHSMLQHMNELAANARRERKVMDLEISNSSLMAINKQLEREVRKQKMELRRFRRLSRAGRFSIAPERESFGEVVEIDEKASANVSGVLDESEDEDEAADDDLGLDDATSESDVDEETLSPNALADRDAKHRLKDEKRLQSDLSKHRQLLVGSQKMNQSLKRCLGWTEELIKEGKKALEYRVNVSDVKLGGRVLVKEDQDDEESITDDMEQAKTLLGAWRPPGPTTPIRERNSFESERTDKDSGVELEGPTETTYEALTQVKDVGLDGTLEASYDTSMAITEDVGAEEIVTHDTSTTTTNDKESDRPATPPNEGRRHPLLMYIPTPTQLGLGSPPPKEDGVLETKTETKNSNDTSHGSSTAATEGDPGGTIETAHEALTAATRKDESGRPTTPDETRLRHPLLMYIPTPTQLGIGSPTPKDKCVLGETF